VSDPGTTLPDYRTEVVPQWVDYNSHLSEAYYVLIFGFATDQLLDVIGMDEEYRRANELSMYTVEAHISYLREVAEGAPVRVTTRLLDVDSKRLHLAHRMLTEDGTLAATEELMLCCVDTSNGRSTTLPGDIGGAINSIIGEQRHLPVDPRVGRWVGAPRDRD
jgi:acyl-CoA thioester hydrolase